MCFDSIQRIWWKEVVVYQIYPRSFKDSNGDGIGDLRGIISKLDYLRDLGVDVLWLSPIYKSPNDDYGYDVSDYYQIMTEFGKKEDFEKLIGEVHERGMKLILDLVVNHTSDEHPWFIESKKSKDNSKRDYYIWQKGKNGAEPNNWASFFGGSAWEYDSLTDEYYLHLFSKKQPDLNWENPEVRQEIYSMMKSWLDKGVDGFRMDVINFLAKAPGFPYAPMDKNNFMYKYIHASTMYANQPGMHEILKEMNQKVLSKYDIMTVGECHYITPETALSYTAKNRKELDMVFQFDIVYSGQDLSKIKESIWKWYDVHKESSWNTITLNNHDTPRQVSVFGDTENYRGESAKLLATFLLTTPGTPFLYQGEEIGMTNVIFDKIKSFRDIGSINRYYSLLKQGKAPEEALANIVPYSRDNARTPFHWDDSKYAGFSEHSPWIDVNPNYQEINVKNSLNDPNSILNYYRSLITYRKKNLALIYGNYVPMETNNPVYAYKRILDKNVFLILLNFSSNVLDLSVNKLNIDDFEVVFSNYSHNIDKNVLKPWQAMIFKKSI